MTECPACRSNAYVGFIEIECSNLQCSFYNEKFAKGVSQTSDDFIWINDLMNFSVLKDEKAVIGDFQNLPEIKLISFESENDATKIKLYRDMNFIGTEHTPSQFPGDLLYNNISFTSLFFAILSPCKVWVNVMISYKSNNKEEFEVLVKPDYYWRIIFQK